MLWIMNHEFFSTQEHIYVHVHLPLMISVDFMPGVCHYNCRGSHFVEEKDRCL